MERRHCVGFERSLEENLCMIADIGFNGVNAQYSRRHDVRRLAALRDAYGAMSSSTALHTRKRCFLGGG
jgi:hypothetical protein